MPEYDPQQVEIKWQKRWDERATNTFTHDELLAAKRPYYNLMMFPYPSAEGLHIGNTFAFTGADVQGRYKRLQGFDVFEPMGFDSFGIHSENFALKRQINPNELIPSNISTFTKQLKRLGGMFDWNHALTTSDPDYYRWTQWVFVQLFKAGLVERKVAPVNWCPSCVTVVANEQVIQGLCERCDTAVEQRRLPQWFFRITDYAQRLLDNLDTIDWSEHTKKAQQHWIGRSEGAILEFPVHDSSDSLKVFTTRPDTIFGATYMVLAPEHPLVEAVTSSEQRRAVATYIEQTSKLDLKQRQIEEREKTGVWTGGYCVNPATNAKIPIWTSDYVLIEYGTGAIMAVPGHDSRDFEFASKFGLPIQRVIATSLEEAEIPLDEAFVDDGVLVNSGTYDGLSVAEGKQQIVAELQARGLGQVSVNYRLHDWCISRQRYWGPPIPIIHCATCGSLPVPESDLPVVLPYLENFTPADDGSSPLSRDPEWCEVACPECGDSAKRETDVSDTFLDSGWYFLRYPCTDNAKDPLTDDIVRRWLPVESYIGGNEHAVLHLLYARFLTMALKDAGVLEFEEPFTRFRAHGLLIREGRKISKSRGNTISGDDIIERYGADTLRLYLMFLGPYEQGGDWQDRGIQGPFNFLRRLWQAVQDAEPGPPRTDVLPQLHRTIERVTQDMEALRFNTAIAALMECLNTIRASGRKVNTDEVEPLVLMVAPLAPHIAEELYEQLGHHDGLFESAGWPTFDLELTKAELVEIGVQINGKLRGTIELSPDAEEAEAMALARQHANVSRYLAEVSVRKSIYIPGRMLNLVVAA